MPLLGWLTLSAKGQPIPFFGLELPALIGPDKATAKNLEDIHELIGNVGYALTELAPQTTDDTTLVLEVSSFQLEAADAFTVEPVA